MKNEARNTTRMQGPNDVKYWVARLGLREHPEGGYYNETYRSDELVDKSALPARYKGFRAFSTSIYFLLPEGSFSAFHRIKSDETWYFHTGDPLEIFVLFPTGDLKQIILGLDEEAVLQYTVPHGTWFASRTLGSFSLVGCNVSPGFDFADFEMGSCKELSETYPEHKEIIQAFTRD